MIQEISGIRSSHSTIYGGQEHNMGGRRDASKRLSSSLDHSGSSPLPDDLLPLFERSDDDYETEHSEKDDETGAVSTGKASNDNSKVYNSRREWTSDVRSSPLRIYGGQEHNVGGRRDAWKSSSQPEDDRDIDALLSLFRNSDDDMDQLEEGDETVSSGKRSRIASNFGDPELQKRADAVDKP